MTSLRTRLGTSLGTSLGTDLSASASDPTAAILALSPYSFIEADYYSVDGVTGKVSAFLDKVAAGTGIKAITANHAITQATSANQCVVPTADASFNNALSASFNNGPYYRSNAPPSAWRLHHDGTGMYVMWIFLPTSVATFQSIESTIPGVAAPGLLLSLNTTAVSGRLFGGAAGNVALATDAAGTAAASVPTCLEFSYVEGGSADYPFEINRFVSGSSVQAMNSLDVPKVVDPGQALNFGSQNGATSLISMRWCSRICFNRVPTAAERVILRAYATSRYGVA